MQARLFFRDYSNPHDPLVETDGRRVGRVIIIGPLHEYVIAWFPGLGPRRVETPVQHARHKRHAETGEWPDLDGRM